MTSVDGQRAATIDFEHVTKRYATDGRSATSVRTGGAVEDLTLSVPAGRICVLVGPSGCGKTTTLKMVNRLIEPTSGRILIDGVDAATIDVVELRRGIGYVIQQVGLFPHQTVADNVATVPRLLGWRASRLRERADELLTLVGLDPTRYRDRFPAQLSGGERQRVGVARALAADPPIMLMDEPFGAVDPIVRERLQNELLRLQDDLAKTILFVTHDIDEAIKMGDLVVVMQLGGRIAQAGPPAELLANPANDFVSRFVGTDRGLKRLSLFRVGDIPLDVAVTAQVGEPVGPARTRARDADATEVLLLDDGDRPIGWIPIGHLPADGPIEASLAIAKSPFLDRRTTLKDAMSMLVDADVPAGIVVDRQGRSLGLLTFAALVAAMRDDRFRGASDDADDATDASRAEGDGEADEGEAPEPPSEREPTGIAGSRPESASG
jgi:osmoprotectant transport system ATP-binding protein